jgi:hypothetical protein
MDLRVNGKTNGVAHPPSWFNRVRSWWRPALVPAAPDALVEARRKVELARSEAELKVLERNKKLLEDQFSGDFFLQPYIDLLDRANEFGDRPFFMSQYSDRQYGRAWPFYVNDGQLAILRAQSRLVCTQNSYATGMLTALTSFVIGKGMTYRPVLSRFGQTKFDSEQPRFLQDVADEVDRFVKANLWGMLEQELFWRSREDGEFFLRFFEDDDGTLIVRTIEPEQIYQPPIPESDYRHYSFGIRTDPEDVLQVMAYWVKYLDSVGTTNDMGEEVPADEVIHMKINTKRTIKRGLMDFSFDAYDAVRAASKIRFNAGEGAAIQASIALIRQWENATQTSVQAFNTTETTFNQTNPVSGRQTNYNQMTPGSILDIPRQMAFVAPPGSAPGAAEGHEIILHAQLRSAGNRWNLPEWVATGSGADMAAYTASLTAENPFVKTAERFQADYKNAFTRVIRKSIKIAIANDRLPPDTLKLVEIQCEGPEIAAKDELQEAQANTARVQGGWKSRQTVAQEEGLDWEIEVQNMEEYQERFGGMGFEGTGSEGQPFGMQPQEQDKDEDESGDEKKPKQELNFESVQLPALMEQVQAGQAKRTQLVLGAAAKLLAEVHKIGAQNSPPQPPPEPSADLKALCEAVQTLASREPAPIQPIIQIPSELEIPAPIVNVAAAQAPIIHVAPPSVTVQAPEVHVAAPEVIAPPPSADRPKSVKRDDQGRICEITYESGAVYVVKRDKEGRIAGQVPKGK